MLSSPLEYYREQCKSGYIVEDKEQLKALDYLERITAQLIQEHKKRGKLTAFLRKPHLVKGLYLWGGVGIGKTFLMDCFYQTLPLKEKLRMHFHQFMRWVHEELKQHQGEKDPLNIIAKELAKKTMVLCFDEFFVSDITDAMLLGRLFRALFAEGVCLVTTSNSVPDDLYKNGLQRSQFVPAIELIKENTHVVHVTTRTDYRLRHLKEAGVFYSPLDDAARENMENSFAALTEGMTVSESPIEINHRSVKIKKQAGDIVWFEFQDICRSPRSQADYLVIAERYRTVFISNIPVIPASAKDMICLFVNLIDVLYDARIRLVISAAKPVIELYSRGIMIMEYARTHSRLLEMQSEDYFINETPRDNNYGKDNL